MQRQSLIGDEGIVELQDALQVSAAGSVPDPTLLKEQTALIQGSALWFSLSSR